MSERPTVETEIDGVKIVHNTYITGAEHLSIRQVYIDFAADPAKIALEADKLALRLVVVSINGETEDVADKILALPLKTYRRISELVTPIIEGEEKKS